MKNTLYLVTSLVSILANASISVYVLYKRPDERINQVFSLWGVTVSIICLGDFMRKMGDTPLVAITWAKLMMVGVTFLMPALLHFALILPPKSEILEKKYFPHLFYIPSLLFLALIPGSFIVSGVELVDWRYSVIWGPWMGVFGGLFGLFMLSGAFIIVKKVWAQRLVKYWFLAFGVFIVIGLVMNFVPIVPWDIPTISPLALFASTLFAYLVITNKFVIISKPESHLETDLKYHLDAGHIYLVKEEEAHGSFSMFLDFVTHGYRGVCISRIPPSKVREDYNLKTTPVFWLSEIKDRYNVHSVESLIRIILSFLEAEEKNSIIILHGLEYVITHNGFLTTLKALHFVNDYVMKNDALMIIPISTMTVNDQQLKLFEAEMTLITDSNRLVITDGVEDPGVHQLVS